LPSCPLGTGKHLVSKVVTSQESASESQEPSDSRVFGNDRLGSIWIAIQRTPDSAPPDSWILAPGTYY